MYLLWHCSHLKFFSVLWVLAKWPLRFPLDWNFQPHCSQTWSNLSINVNKWIPYIKCGYITNQMIEFCSDKYTCMQYHVISNASFRFEMFITDFTDELFIGIRMGFFLVGMWWTMSIKVIFICKWWTACFAHIFHFWMQVSMFIQLSYVPVIIRTMWTPIFEDIQ